MSKNKILLFLFAVVFSVSSIYSQTPDSTSQISDYGIDVSERIKLPADSILSQTQMPIPGDRTYSLKNTTASNLTNPLGTDSTLYMNYSTSETKPSGTITKYTNYYYNETNGLPSQILEEDGSHIIRFTETKYAHDYYPGMKENYMLSQEYTSSVYLNTDASENIKSSVKTTWALNNGKWNKDCEYSFNEQDSPYLDGDTDPNYMLNSDVDFDSYGNLIKSTDANGIITKYAYGYKNSKLIGTVQNCGNGANEIYIDDFNDGSIVDNSPVTYSYKTGASVDNGYLTMLSGIVSIPSLNYQSFNADFSTKIDNSNGWIGIQFGATTTDVVASGLIVYYTYDGTISLYDKRTLLTSASTGKVGNVWRRINLNVSGSSIKVYLDGSSILNYTYSSSVPTGIVALHSIDRALVDNFRVYPSAAQAVSYAYDPETLNLTEQVDQNGVPTFYKYDGFSRPIQKLALVDGKKVPLEEYRYTLSRTVGDTYSATRPNTRETVAFLNSTGYNDFSSSEGWTLSDATDCTFNCNKNGETSVRIGDPNLAWTTISRPAGTGSYIAKVDVYIDANVSATLVPLALETANDKRFGIGYNPTAKRFFVQYRIVSNGSWVYPRNLGIVVDPSKPTWYTIELEKTKGGEVYAYVYRRGEGRIYNTAYMYYISGFGESWSPNVISYGSSQYMYLSNFYFGQIDHTIQFIDGEGKIIQTQKQNGTNAVILSSTEYDALGRQYRTYKPYEKDLGGYARYAYDANYAANSDYYYNNMGDYGTFSATGGYPYSQTSYYTDPTDKVYKVSFPGAAWSMGSTHEQQFEYLATGTLKRILFSDENAVVNGVRTISKEEQKDIYGNVVASKIDPEGINLTTTFKYDLLGNLIETADPKGYPTKYVYNTLGQLTKKTSPDAGIVEYLYDKVGNLRLIKDANHAGTFTSVNFAGGTNASGTFTLNSWTRLYISVSNYLTTGGSASLTITTNVTGYNTTLFSKSITTLLDYEGYLYLPKGTYKYMATIGADGWFSINSVQHKEYEYRKYDAFNRVYDIGENLTTTNIPFTETNMQTNAANPAFPTSGLIARNKYYYYDGPSPMAVASGQRNLKGRVSYASTYQDGALHQHTFYSYDDLGRVEWVVQYFATGYNAKIKYNYDLQGKLVKKEYLQTSNNMYTFYEYDQMQRLTNVYTGTNSDGSNKIKDAAYTYNAGGTVKRLQLANAQGVDYCYNSRDWLTMINQQNLNSDQDPGHDGPTLTSYPSVDKFGMVLGYDVYNHIGSAQGAAPQYNGNISWQMYNIGGLAFNSFPLVGASYTYDKANRLKKSDFGYYDGSWKPATAYDMSNISYDNNGNITLLNRYGTQNSLMDNQTYNYIGNTNKLQSITDAALPSMSGSDIDNQASNNYAYDANGNLTQDLQNGVGFIYYDINNLPLKMYKTNGTVLEYGYDATGNRSYNKPENRYYINNLSGANEAVASSVTSTTVSYNIYGNDNIGMIDKIGTTYNRYYYLKDHLGSIRVRVDATGAVKGWHDYYPFGMSMDLRDGNSGGNDIYKYTGKERDAVTIYDYFGARYYDGRVGRWLSVDPLALLSPNTSPYAYCFNNPITYIDLYGRHPILGQEPQEQNDTDEEPGVVYVYGERIYDLREFWRNFVETISPSGGYDYPDQKEDGRLNTTSQIIDISSNGLTAAAYSTHNDLYWIQKNGKFRFATEKTLNNILFKNSYSIAGKSVRGLQAASKVLAPAATVIAVADLAIYPTLGKAVDLGVSSGLALIPVVGWGLSAAYCVTNTITVIATNKSIGDHVSIYIQERVR